MKNIINNLKRKNYKIGVIGLGYVGLPVAVQFSGKYKVIGYDISSKKVQELNNGLDVSLSEKDDLTFTYDEKDLKDIGMYIIAVPTPVDDDNIPKLDMLKSASEVVGRNISIGSVVVYESTVYPGVTESICKDIIEKISGLKCGEDFKIAYSPERINPGDTNHAFCNTTKIVSGMDNETLDTVYEIYSSCLDAELYKASSIKIAEAAKVLENTQRDVNIALINECAIIFNKMNIDTHEVINAAKTKWNFIHFEPGLVGGHCIGVDPYYLSYIANKNGCRANVINAARKTNNYMGQFIVEDIIKIFIKNEIRISNSKILIMGITFKESCSDVRNTKVIDIIQKMREYGIKVFVTDPIADKEQVQSMYSVELINLEEAKRHEFDSVVVAVAHKEYVEYSIEQFRQLMPKHQVIFDVKGKLDAELLRNNGFIYWRL